MQQQLQRSLSVDTMVVTAAPDPLPWPVSPTSPFGPPNRWLRLLPESSPSSAPATRRPKQSSHAEKVTRTESTSIEMPSPSPNAWLKLLPDLEPTNTTTRPELTQPTPDGLIRVSGLREFDEEAPDAQDQSSSSTAGDSAISVDDASLSEFSHESAPSQTYIPTALYQFSPEDGPGGFHWIDPFMSEDEFHYNYSDHDLIKGPADPWMSSAGLSARVR